MHGKPANTEMSPALFGNLATVVSTDPLKTVTATVCFSLKKYDVVWDISAANTTDSIGPDQGIVLSSPTCVKGAVFLQPSKLNPAVTIPK